MKRKSYQHGSVVCRPCKRGPDAWIFRYMEDGVQKAKKPRACFARCYIEPAIFMDESWH